MTKGYTREDSNIIGFVISCLYTGVINDEEFLKWVYYSIEKHDDLPLYMYDLADYKGERLHLESRIIGFATSSPYPEQEMNALYGLIYKRGNKPYEDFRYTKEEALKLLEKYPHIEQKFREVFPFIKY